MGLFPSTKILNQHIQQEHQQQIQNHQQNNQNNQYIETPPAKMPRGKADSKPRGLNVSTFLLASPSPY